MELDRWKDLIGYKSHDLKGLLECITIRISEDYGAKAEGEWVDKDGWTNTGMHTLPSVIYHRHFSQAANDLNVEFTARTGIVRVLVHRKLIESFGTRF